MGMDLEVNEARIRAIRRKGGHSSLVEHMFSRCQALGLIPSTKKKKKKKTKKKKKKKKRKEVQM
jgi:hypothetical protein